MDVRISRSLLNRILHHAGAEPGREVCGLLLGTGGQVLDIMPAANVADDPAQRFEIDPAVLLGAMKAARTGGPQVIGHYHSHPSGTAQPSACDADLAAADGAYWMLVAGGEAALWQAGEDGLHGRFQPMTLSVEAD